MPWTARMVLIVGALCVPFQLYAAHRVGTAISLLTGWRKSTVRGTATVALLYPALYPLFALAGITLGMPRLYAQSSMVDKFLTFPFWIGVVIAVQISLVLLAADILFVILYYLFKDKRLTLVRARTVLTVALAATLLIYCVGRIYADTLTVRTKRTSLTIPNLSSELRGLRIVQISDVHVDARTNGAKLQRYIDRVNSLNPDIVVFCGDLVSGGTSYIDQAAAALGKIKAKYGVFACMGDHDYFSNPDMVQRRLETNGILVLRDKSSNLQIGSTEISLTGLTNVYSQPATTQLVHNLSGLRQRTPLDILFTHQPSTWLPPMAASEGYSLMLAGHTHGGQVVFQLPGFLLTGSSFETRYVSGFFKVHGMPLSVCNGLGETLAPIRYQAPAEVTEIDLQ